MEPYRTCRKNKVATAIAAFMLLLTGFAAAPANAVPIDNATTLDDIRWSEEFLPEHADVLRLYRAFFNREADVDGAKYWIDQYDSGATLDDITWSFANGTEFQTQYGNVSNAQFLTIAYNNILGRPYDQAGFDYWLAQLDSAVLTQPGVIRWMAASQEFRVRRPQAPAEHYAGALIPASELPSGTVSNGWELIQPYPYSVCANIGAPYGHARNSLYMSGDSVPTEVYSSWVIPFRTSQEATDYFNNVLAPYFLTCGVPGTTPLPASGLGQESFGVALDKHNFIRDFQYARQDNVIVGVYTVNSSLADWIMSVVLNRLASS